MDINNSQISDTTQTTPSIESGNTIEQRLNDGLQRISENTTNTEGGEQTAQEQQPQHVPFEDHKAVQDQFNQLQAQYAQTQQYLNQMAMLLYQNQVPKTQTETPQYDPQEELARFEQDPKAYLQNLRNDLKTEVISEFARTQRADQEVKSALETVAQQHPGLNTDQGKYFVYQYALHLNDDPSLRGYNIHQLFDHAAKTISGFVGSASQSLTQNKATTRQDAFVEGASNHVPDRSGPNAKYQEMRSKGDVTGMLAAKLSKFTF